MIYENHLYILETYIQQIRKISLVDKSEEIIYPFPRAIMAWYKHHGMEGSLADYAHMNAITVQDDRFYISCPRLRSKINSNGQPDQDRNPTIIKVFSNNWKLIDEIDTGRFFCHDLVIIGHDIYFADATNTICKVNSVTHEVSEVWKVEPVSPDLRRICRGLSISSNGQVFVGTHDFDGNSYAVDVIENKRVSMPDTPCCIMQIDGSDYCDEQSPLRTSHLVTGQVDDVPFINEIYEKLTEVHREKQVEGVDALPPQSIFNPKLENYGDAPEYFNNGPSKIILWNKEFILPAGFTESGPFYLYPRGHGMDWHTNINNLTNDSGMKYLRLYTISCTGDSYFFYRNPISKQIHAVKDVDGQFLIFNLKYPNFQKFWHAVYTKTGSRLSYGIKFAKQQLFDLGLKNIWNFSSSPPIGLQEAIKYQHVWSNFKDPIPVEWLTNLLNKIPTLDFRNVIDMKKYSKVGWFSDETASKFLSSKLRQCNLEMFKFNLSNFSECMEYREFDETYKNSDWSMDVWENNSSRKLSAILFLTDPSEYEGGELSMITSAGSHVVQHKRKGEIIVFPSYLMYRINDVKRGVLRLLAFWAEGPAFV
jgi:hypothetical protein